MDDVAVEVVGLAPRVRATAAASIGVPLGIVYFVCLNWLTSYFGGHALEGRPIVPLLIAAVLVGACLYAAHRAPLAGLFQGVTMLALIIVGLFLWSPAHLTIEQFSFDPVELLAHGACELLILTFAVTLVATSLSRLRTAPSTP